MNRDKHRGRLEGMKKHDSYSPFLHTFFLSFCRLGAGRFVFVNSSGDYFMDIRSFPGSPAGKESACNAGNPGSIPGSERSAGEGKGYTLQYSGLENSLLYRVHGVAKSRTGLSHFHFHFRGYMWFIRTICLDFSFSFSPHFCFSNQLTS